MNKYKNIVNLLVSIDVINMVCNNIADNKSYIEVDRLLIEELSELIRAVIKLERLDNRDTSLRYNFNEIFNNLYEELADVIIMILQFIYKNDIEYGKLLNKMCEKLIRYYETISDK